MLTLTTFHSLQPDPHLFNFDRLINQDNHILNSTSSVFKKKQEDYLQGHKVLSQEQLAKGNAPNFDYNLVFSVDIKQNSKLSYTI